MARHPSKRLLHVEWPLNKNQGLLPIGGGEMLRRIAGKVIMRIAKNDTSVGIHPTLCRSKFRCGSCNICHTWYLLVQEPVGFCWTNWWANSNLYIMKGYVLKFMKNYVWHVRLTSWCVFRRPDKIQTNYQQKLICVTYMLIKLQL